MTESKSIRLCVAGATGWAASELCKAIVQTKDIDLVAAVSRKNSGGDLNVVLNLGTDQKIPIFGSVEEALQTPCDVLIDYTAPDVAKSNVITALNKGLNVVIGTSGLSDEDYKEIETVCKEKKSSVLAVGNFAISVVLLNLFSEIAAKHISQWEIIDYASDKKKDAPSGSALELADRLSAVAAPKLTIPIGETFGFKETRGATIGGSQVHSVRLPGFVIALESIFGLEGEKLTIRHEAGDSAKPYVNGALLAIRKIDSFQGFKRGLDQVMDLK